MNYEIVFIHKAFGQTWEEAFQANEERSLSLESSRTEPAQANLDQLEHVAGLLQNVNSDLAQLDGSGSIELSDDKSGVHIFIYEHEVKITIPYDFSGRAAWRQMTRAYKYGKIIEREMGLIGYDLQRNDTFLHSEESIGLAVDILSSTSKGIHRDSTLGSTDKPEKPWWKFWD